MAQHGAPANRAVESIAELEKILKGLRVTVALGLIYLAPPELDGLQMVLDDLVSSTRALCGVVASTVRDEIPDPEPA